MVTFHKACQRLCVHNLKAAALPWSALCASRMLHHAQLVLGQASVSQVRKLRSLWAGGWRRR